MDNKIQKCPLCGTKLKIINGRMTCKDCGYYLRSDSGMSESTGSTAQPDSSAARPNGSAAQSGGSAAQPNGNAAQSGGRTQYSGPVQPNYYRGLSVSGPSSTKKSSSSVGYRVKTTIFSILAVVVVGIVIGLLKSGLADALEGLFKDDEPPAYSDEVLDSWKNSVTIKPQIPAAATPRPDSSTSAAARLPESGFFCQFIEAVYNKGYRVVTAEEYAAITMLELNRDEKIIYYQINHGDTQFISYQTDSGLKLSDLSCFTGLEALYLDDDLRSGDLKGLNNLYAVHAENTFTDLAKIIPHPENIVDLGVYDWTFVKGLTDIDKFPNLQYLSVDYDSLADISALSAYPGLLGLELLNCDLLTDYSPLMSMTKLQELYIQSGQLKTIDFIKQMPDLVRFSLEDSKVLSVEALASCPDLTYLSLMDNYNVSDYSVISELTDLNYLALGVGSNSNITLPSFKDLSDLEYLSLKGVRDLSPLQDAVNVTSLILEDCTSYDLDAITVMQELTQLRIKDFINLTESLAPLTKLPNLEMLNLSDSKIHGFVEEIFGIPSLKYLCLDKCQVGINFDAVPSNSNLEALTMDGIRILKDPSYNSAEQVYLSQHYDFFENFPGLKILYLQSDHLDSLEFVEDLPDLKYLDITNNYITSLTPLLQLKNFDTVWCGGQTILENIPSDSKIHVLTTDRN